MMIESEAYNLVKKAYLLFGVNPWMISELTKTPYENVLVAHAVNVGYLYGENTYSSQNNYFRVTKKFIETLDKK